MTFIFACAGAGLLVAALVVRGTGKPGRHLTSPEHHMFVLVRALTYATAFIAFLLVFVPGRILERSGITQPPALGPVELAGVAVGLLGAVLTVWCILTFALAGRGTPAPFDPPRRLVVRGPYRYLRNPMYLGAFIALGGAAMVYRSIPLAGYAGLFLLATHLFVVWYEEPTLAHLFGEEYQRYRAEVRRWLPRTRGFVDNLN